MQCNLASHSIKANISQELTLDTGTPIVIWITVEETKTEQEAQVLISGRDGGDLGSPTVKSNILPCLHCGA